MKKILLLLFLFISTIKVYSQCYSQISSKVFHNLSIKNDGTLWAWGRNIEDQIGDNSGNNQPAPIQIGTDNDWRLVSAGTYHSVALKSNGTLWAWGDNQFGQTGNLGPDVPAIVGTDNDWVYAVAGLGNSAAIKSDGTLWMWGFNMYGQLGNGSTVNSNIPIQVGTGHDWLTITLGSQNALAIKTNGTLWAWGLNSNGQLGLGNTMQQNIPVQVGTATDWVKIASGYTCSYAIKSNGTLWAWGSNTFGGVGNGSTIDRTTPLQIGTDTWQSVAATHHCMAIKSNGTLWSWGWNTYGQIGNGMTSAIQSLPVQVGTATDWIKCSTGFYHSIALRGNGTLWSWGDNQYGNLGNGTFTSNINPSQVGSLCSSVLCNIVVPTLVNFTGQCSVSLSNITAPTTTDSCGNVITGTLYNGSFPVLQQGNTTIVWKFANSSGYITVPQTITITDTQMPVPLVNQLPNITAQCQVSLSDITVPLANDNCAGQITGTTTAVFPITAQGSTVIIWTYNDSHGNTATQQQTVVIADTQTPVPQISQLPNITAQCQVSLSDITAPFANDNCAGQITGTTTAVFPITAQGSTVITWTYNDSHGNTATQQQTVVIADTQTPVPQISQLPNITAQCLVSLSDITAPFANDNCAGQITGTTTAVFPITAQGGTVITWTYNDGHGNTATQQQTVIISDTQAPVPQISQLPNITVQCQVSLSDINAPLANDNCAGQITGTTTTVFPITTQGTTTINWTYNDDHGNTATQQQVITINDTQAPVPQVSQLPNIIGQCQVLFSDITSPQANDNCTGQLTGTTTAVFPIASQGSTVIIWTYNDGHDNISTQQQTVLIDDTIFPVAMTQDITIDLEGSNSVLILPEQINNDSTDNCGISEYSLEPNSFNSPGQYNVTLTVMDYGGNFASEQATVTIIDSTASLIDFAESNIKLFPVPIMNLLNITTSNDLIIIGITIYDNLGREVFKSSENKSIMDLSELSAGGYYIQLFTNKGTYKKLIIKE